MYKIYKIVFKPKNAIVYIGCTRRSLSQRFSEHIRHAESAINKLIKKHGKESFSAILIDSAEDEKEAFAKEEFWTLFFRKRSSLYNKMDGRKLTKRQKETLFQSRIGSHHTEETKEKIRVHFLGKPGKKHTIKTKQKLSDLRKGNKNPFFGKHHTTAFKRKVSKPVLCVTTGECFSSMKEAGDRYNLSYSSNIGKCCRGRLTHYGILPNGQKLVWKYVLNSSQKGA